MSLPVTQYKVGTVEDPEDLLKRSGEKSRRINSVSVNAKNYYFDQCKRILF